MLYVRNVVWLCHEVVASSRSVLQKFLLLFSVEKKPQQNSTRLNLLPFYLHVLEYIKKWGTIHFVEPPYLCFVFVLNNQSLHSTYFQVMMVFCLRKYIYYSPVIIVHKSLCLSQYHFVRCKVFILQIIINSVQLAVLFLRFQAALPMFDMNC